VHLPIFKAGDVWAPSSGEEAKHFLFVYCAEKTNRLRKRQKGLHSRCTYLAAGAASSCPVFSVASTYFSLSIYTVQGTEEGRERNSKGRRGRYRYTLLLIPLRSPRLVSSVLEFTVATDWMAPVLSVPWVASCSLCWAANLSLAPRFGLIHLFLQSCHS
jgi:hypothetical protein